jgi:hypothetical protein
MVAGSAPSPGDNLGRTWSARRGAAGRWGWSRERSVMMITSLEPLRRPGARPWCLAAGIQLCGFTRRPASANTSCRSSASAATRASRSLRRSPGLPVGMHCWLMCRSDCGAHNAAGAGAAPPCGRRQSAMGRRPILPSKHAITWRRPVNDESGLARRTTASIDIVCVIMLTPCAGGVLRGRWSYSRAAVRSRSGLPCRTDTWETRVAAPNSHWAPLG